VSVSKLSAFIDFFNFLPYAVKKTKNNSKEIFYIMTSNQKGEASYNNKTSEDTHNKNDEKEQLTLLLSMIWAKLYERFPTINAAFRFFDSNYD
jgi:hypothetical protein